MTTAKYAIYSGPSRTELMAATPVWNSTALQCAVVFTLGTYQHPDPHTPAKAEDFVSDEHDLPLYIDCVTTTDKPNVFTLKLRNPLRTDSWKGVYDVETGLGVIHTDEIVP